MTKLLLLCLIFLFSISALALKRTPLYSCQLNRSITLMIILKERNNLPDVVLQKRHFLEESAQDVITLIKPQVINSENVFIVISDMGKDGYVFIRIQKQKVEDLVNKNEKIIYYNGALDINLHGTNEGLNAISTHGNLMYTFCSRLN